MDNESGEFWTGIWRWVAVPLRACHRTSVGLSFLACNMEPSIEDPWRAHFISFLPLSLQVSPSCKALVFSFQHILHLHSFSPLAPLFLVLLGNGGLQVWFDVYPLLDNNGELSKPWLISDQADFSEQEFALLWLGHRLCDVTGRGEARDCQNVPVRDVKRNWEERDQIRHLFPFLICVFMYFLVRDTVPLALSQREAQRFRSCFSSRSSNFYPNSGNVG